MPIVSEKGERRTEAQADCDDGAEGREEDNAPPGHERSRCSVLERNQDDEAERNTRMDLHCSLCLFQGRRGREGRTTTVELPGTSSSLASES